MSNSSLDNGPRLGAVFSGADPTAPDLTHACAGALQPCADTAAVAQQLINVVLNVEGLLEHLVSKGNEDAPALMCAISMLGQMGMLADTLVMAHGVNMEWHANPAEWLFGELAADAFEALRARRQS